MHSTLLLGDYLLLRKMRKAQKEKSDVVGVDSFGHYLYPVSPVGNKSEAVRLKGRTEKELDPALRSLVSNGYLEKLPDDDGEGRYRITYKGLHVYQPTVLRLAYILCTSFLLPAAVAVCSTLAVCRLSG